MDRLISQFPKAVAAYFAQQGLTGSEADSARLSDLARQVEAIASQQAEGKRQAAQEEETQEEEMEGNDGR